EDGAWEPIPVTVRDEATGEERTVRVIGVVDSAITSGIVPSWIALMVPESTALEVLDDPAQAYFINAVGGGGRALEVAQGIESTLLEQGVQADSLQQLLDDSTAQQNAFSMLFVGFM